MKRLTLVALGLAFAAGAAPCATARAQSSGLPVEFIGQLDDAATKLVQLAEATPQDKYTWRPETGVRSFSEVLMHVVGANYYIPTFAGVKSPGDLPRDAEKSVTQKTQVIDHLKRSFDHVRGGMRALKEADLNKPASMFGRQTTVRDVFFTTVTHAHEHLGQLIAYARVNGVTPPWSAGAGR